ncbi:EndoU domain-containing protein [Paenibacillus spiritus]|uniref:EndoU domain-containing protein n=1 Tax=Paenibacillus spiritus TaxID=2496557 RepID=UPI001CC6AB21|nr:EndoU domain-containing protein [Paenibacillus spiritus]
MKQMSPEDRTKVLGEKAGELAVDAVLTKGAGALGKEALNAIPDVGNTPTISTRLRDGATWHRATINGIEIDVIKDGDDVTSGYPTGTINSSRPSGF